MLESFRALVNGRPDWAVMCALPNPLLLAGLFGRFYYKLNYYTLIGVLSGASTNPPALAYSTEQTTSDAPSVGYATVYPLSMFLRVLAAQLLILIFG